MSSKIRSKLAKLDKSLDQLESQLEPLLAKSLPETLLHLDTLQQAKLQVIIPYVLYDLVFVYLKSRGIDPKTHRVVAELERVRGYFEKIANAENKDQKRQLGIDKAVAGRFIKHAIAQAKNAPSVDEPSDDAPVASTSHVRVPIKVTSKMAARAEYEKELKELGNEEEDDLEVFDEDASEEVMDGPPEDMKPAVLDKGKGRASEEELSESEQISLPQRKRPRVDPFSGYDNLPVSESTLCTADHREKAKHSPLQSMQGGNPSHGASVSSSTSEDREARKATKKGKHRAKKLRNV